jgi:hypothetical protein
MTNTPENCEKLAWQVVNSMDMGDLCRCMADHLAANYEEDGDLFTDDWENLNGDDENDA